MSFARSVAGSFLAQVRAPTATAESGVHRAVSDRGLVLWTLVLTGLVLGVLRVLLPTTEGAPEDDSELYLSLARDPIDNPLIAETETKFASTFALRLLVPVVVWLLPVEPNLGFHFTSLGGLLAGGVVVALLARKLGVGGLALAAGPAYVLSFHGIYGLWSWRMVDTVTLALVAGAVLAAYTSHPVICSLLAAATVTSKEIGLVLPIAWFAVRRSAGTRRALVEAALVAAPAAILFAVMRFSGLIPHQTWDAWDQFKFGFTTQGEWGYVRPLLQVFLQNHGMLWLLWPLAVLIGPPRWRRLHLFVAVLVPFLVGGPWARSVGYLLPFVLPSALFVLARGRTAFALAALAGSAAVAVPLALRNIAIDELGSNALLLPGMLVFAVFAFPAARRAVSEARERWGAAGRPRRVGPPARRSA